MNKNLKLRLKCFYNITGHTCKEDMIKGIEKIKQDTHFDKEELEIVLNYLTEVLDKRARGTQTMLQKRGLDNGRAEVLYDNCPYCSNKKRVESKSCKSCIGIQKSDNKVREDLVKRVRFGKLKQVRKIKHNYELLASNRVVQGGVPGNNKRR